jgi:hypothetical protein
MKRIVKVRLRRYFPPCSDGPAQALTLYFVPQSSLLTRVVLARSTFVCDSSQHWNLRQDSTVTKGTVKTTPKNEKSAFNRDRRRKHHHWLVTVFYADGEKFGRVYTDKDKATRFADRQKRSPVVKSARITQVS